MSISTSITGGSQSNQLMDLLAVVANPDVYKAKLDALEAATAENKKYVEAIGPASEIVVLRDEAKTKAEQAQIVLNKAEADALLIMQNAKAGAQSVLQEAQAQANNLTADATKIKENADKIFAQVQAELTAAQKATDEAKKAQAVAQAKEQELTQALEEAEAAKAQAQSTKADILAKHQEFIRGL